MNSTDGLITAVAIIYLVIAGIVWVCKEHRDAVKYRELIKLHELGKLQSSTTDKSYASTKPKWLVTYKQDKKTLTKEVEGSTEAEAMKAFTRSGGAWGNILKMEKL